MLCVSAYTFFLFRILCKSSQSISFFSYCSLRFSWLPVFSYSPWILDCDAKQIVIVSLSSIHLTLSMKPNKKFVYKKNAVLCCRLFFPIGFPTCIYSMLLTFYRLLAYIALEISINDWFALIPREKKYATTTTIITVFCHLKFGTYKNIERENRERFLPLKMTHCTSFYFASNRIRMTVQRINTHSQARIQRNTLTN